MLPVWGLVDDDDWDYYEFNKAFVGGAGKRALGKLTANSIIGRLLHPPNDKDEHHHQNIFRFNLIENIQSFHSIPVKEH